MEERVGGEGGRPALLAAVARPDPMRQPDLRSTQLTGQGNTGRCYLPENPPRDIRRTPEGLPADRVRRPDLSFRSKSAGVCPGRPGPSCRAPQPLLSASSAGRPCRPVAAGWPGKSLPAHHLPDRPGATAPDLAGCDPRRAQQDGLAKPGQVHRGETRVRSSPNRRTTAQKMKKWSEGRGWRRRRRSTGRWPQR